ncbi:hypothetical protein [Mycobacterium sp. Lab-001]|uniref:hypothetical protein n=1 Tax=Mycobacterium sp. Lab-001 TaxID=3410136 RepID=UPI003D171E0B
MTAARFDPEGAIRLMASMLAGAPKLSDAGCRGRFDLFDDRRGDEDAEDAAVRHQQAVQLCHACPALDACTAWTARLRGRHRPGGVIAGEVPKPSPERKNPHDH